MTRLPASRRFPGLLLIAALIGRAGDVRAGDDPPAQSPTAEERQAAAALDAIGATLRINGQFQIVSVSLLNDDAITNDILAHVGRLKDLQSLSVAGLKITDEALQQFAGLKRLTTLTLRDAAATDEGIARLQAALPECRIRRSTSAAGFAVAPNAFGGQRAPPVEAAALAERRAALEAARQRGGFGRGPAAAEALETPSASSRTFVPNIYYLELRKTDVQIEIELTSQQWDALQSMQTDGAAAYEELREKIRDIRERPSEAEQNELREKLQSEIDQISAAAEERVKVLLSTEQFQRLQQLTWYTRGPTMLMDAAFAAELGLDDTQRAQVEAIREEQREVFAQLADPNLRRSPLRSQGPPDSREQLLAILTDEQRAAYEKKLGPPPETDVERVGQHVFALLDTNGNEELSEEEWGSVDSRRLLPRPRGRVRVELPLMREEFVRIYIALRERMRSETAAGF